MNLTLSAVVVSALLMMQGVAPIVDNSIATMILTEPKRPLHVGRDSLIHADVTNISTKAITFTEGESGGEFDVQLFDDLDPEHKDLFLPEKRRAASLPSSLGGHSFAFEIKPGESLGIEVLLNLSRIESHPGAYTILIARPVHGTGKLITALPLHVTIGPALIKK